MLWESTGLQWDRIPPKIDQMKLLFNPSDVDIMLMKIFHYDREIMIIFLCNNEILYRPIVCAIYLDSDYIEKLKFSKSYIVM